MEVSRPCSPCGCHFRGFSEGGTLQRLLTPDRHRPPVLNFGPRGSPDHTECERRSEGYRAQESERPETRTLEGVLRGEVLSLFSDLRRNSPQTVDRNDITNRHIHSPAPRQGIAPSPQPSTSPVVVTPYSLKRSYCSIEQDQPIDLSCKKMCGDTPRQHFQLGISNRDNIKESHTPLPGRNGVSMANQKGPSLLRNLLCLGKDLDSAPQYVSRSENFTKTFPGHVHIKSENSAVGEHDSHRRSHTVSSPNYLQNRISPANLCGRAPLSSTRVTLAKKNMLPVSARVSDWLVKIIRFAKSIPEFSSLLHNDKLALLLNSWARLLLLYMAENNFQFAVTPDLLVEQHQVKVQCPENAGNQEEPTMKGVESVQTFIRKCQNMGTDSKEFAFLRMAVLFNAGIRGLDRPDMVDRVNSSVQQLLQQHVQASRPRDFMHYSRLLMSLPALYGINCKMVENLFCRHINGNMDMEVLLKEMLQNI